MDKTEKEIAFEKVEMWEDLLIEDITYIHKSVDIMQTGEKWISEINELYSNGRYDEINADWPTDPLDYLDQEIAQKNH